MVVFEEMTNSEINLRVTGQSSQGGRKYMEDAFVVAYQQTEDKKDLEYAFFGIFDGHGGKEAAQYAKNNLLDNIVCLKNFWQDEDDMILSAIRDGFLNTHMAMWKEVENWPKTASGLNSTAGTTASVAFIRKGKLYTGHVGDSRIVIGLKEQDSEEWQAESLTVDHKPETPLEKQRIIESGGLVMNKSGVERVVWKRPKPGHEGPILRSTDFEKIPFLAVARSLGDLWSFDYFQQEFAVSPEPDLGVMRLDLNKDKCLILASDGLWNIMSPQDAVHLVQDVENENGKLISKFGVSENIHLTLCNPSRVLVDCSLERWNQLRTRADNVSVLTVLLDETPSSDPPSEKATLKINHPRSLPVWDVGLRCRSADSPAGDKDMTEKETSYLQAALENSNFGKCGPNCSTHNDSKVSSSDNCKDTEGQSSSKGCCSCDEENCSGQSDDCPHDKDCGCDATERHSNSPLQSCSNFLPEYCTEVFASKTSRRDTEGTKNTPCQFPRWSKSASGRTSLSTLATWSRVVSHRRMSDPFPNHSEDDERLDAYSMSDDENSNPSFRGSNGARNTLGFEQDSAESTLKDMGFERDSAKSTLEDMGFERDSAKSTLEDMGFEQDLCDEDKSATLGAQNRKSVVSSSGDTSLEELGFERDLCDPQATLSVVQNYENEVSSSGDVTLEELGFERDLCDEHPEVSVNATGECTNSVSGEKSSFVEHNFKVSLDQLSSIKQAIKRKYPGAEISQSFISSSRIEKREEVDSKKKKLDFNFGHLKMKGVVTKINS